MTPAGGDLLLTQQAADNVTRKLTYTQLDLFIRVPNGDGTKDLGSAAARFRDLYLSRKVTFSDAAADPTAAGQFQRNVADLKFHDGTAVRTLLDTADAVLIEAIIKKIQESGGPTTLTAGAVADGKFFKRSGTTFIGADSPTPDQQTRNLLLNGDLEDWRDGTAVAPFAWTLVGAGATVARDGTNFKTGKFAASLTRVTNDCQLERDAIAEAGGQAHIRSRQYTFAAWVRASVAARVRLRLNDGVGSEFSSYHTGGGAFELLTVTRTLNSLATALKAGLQIDTGDTNGQIDGAMLVEGPSAPAFALRGETSVFRQIFTAGGTYTKPTNLIAARVIAVGGGGSGGGADTTSPAEAPGGGGGAGSYSESMLLASAIGATETVTIGAAGAVGDTQATPTVGGNGGDCSFGTLVIGKGGTGGGAASDNTPGQGGVGGVAGTGQIALAGGDGAAGPTVGGITAGGHGGSSYFGGAGRGVLSGAGAAGKTNTGGGGGGGNGANLANNGGAGGTGIVIVQETVVV